MVTASMIPAFLAASAAAAREKAVLDAFGAVGADAPSRAVPLAALRALDADDLGRLIERGAVREGAPGTFYRYVPAPRARAADQARARGSSCGASSRRAWPESACCSCCSRPSGPNDPDVRRSARPDLPRDGDGAAGPVTGPRLVGTCPRCGRADVPLERVQTRDAEGRPAERAREFAHRAPGLLRW
jgi:hypothetical protein